MAPGRADAARRDRWDAAETLQQAGVAAFPPERRAWAIGYVAGANALAWIVINRNLGGDSLHTWLTGLGWQVERTASQRGFRVLRVTAKTD